MLDRLSVTVHIQAIVTVHGMNSFKIATKKSAKTRAKYTQL